MEILLSAGADIIGEIAEWLSLEDLENLVNSSYQFRRLFLPLYQIQKVRAVMPEIAAQAGKECLKMLRLGGKYIPNRNTRTMTLEYKYARRDTWTGERMISYDLPKYVCIHDISIVDPYREADLFRQINNGIIIASYASVIPLGWNVFAPSIPCINTIDIWGRPFLAWGGKKFSDFFDKFQLHTGDDCNGISIRTSVNYNTEPVLLIRYTKFGTVLGRPS